MKAIFREGNPYMAGTATYPETYSAECPAWCYEEGGLWVIRYAGEHATTVCEYGTEPTEERARRVVDMLNGSTDRVREQQTQAVKKADRLSRESAQGVLL